MDILERFEELQKKIKKSMLEAANLKIWDLDKTKTQECTYCKKILFTDDTWIPICNECERDYR